MAWSISDLFPPWGDSGSRPADNFQYDGGDQVNEKHLDYLWNQVSTLENETRAALNDIDSDSNGVVNNSDKYSGTAPSDGSSGQVLETNGNNNVNWVSTSSGASEETVLVYDFVMD